MNPSLIVNITPLCVTWGFVRVNKEGVRIGQVELQMSLLAGYIGGEFSKLMREEYDSLKDRYSLDLVPFLRLVLSSIGLKQTDMSKVARENPEKFKGRVKKELEKQGLGLDKLGIIFNSSSKAMDLALKLLYSRLGVKKASMLPSQLTLIPIAKYIQRKNIKSINLMDSDDIEKIIAWLIIANFRGRYTSSTDTKLQRDIETVEKSPYIFPLEELIMEMGGRRNAKISLNDLAKGNEINVLRKAGLAYLFILYATLIKEDADDWTGALIKSRDINDLAKHHIFPKDYLEESEITPDDPREKKIFMSGLGNITFINKETNSEIGGKSPDEYLPDYRESLKSHFIPLDEGLWKIYRFEKFKEERVKIIYNAAKKHFSLAFE